MGSEGVQCPMNMQCDFSTADYRRHNHVHASDLICMTWKHLKSWVAQVYPYGCIEAQNPSASTLVEGHDIRGTPALLQALASRPGAFITLGKVAKSV